MTSNTNGLLEKVTAIFNEHCGDPADDLTVAVLMLCSAARLAKAQRSDVIELLNETWDLMEMKDKMPNVFTKIGES